MKRFVIAVVVFVAVGVVAPRSLRYRARWIRRRKPAGVADQPICDHAAGEGHNVERLHDASREAESADQSKGSARKAVKHLVGAAVVAIVVVVAGVLYTPCVMNSSSENVNFKSAATALVGLLALVAAAIDLISKVHASNVAEIWVKTFQYTAAALTLVFVVRTALG